MTIPLEHLRDADIEGMKVGDERKLNHSDCPMGVDHKGRLNVLRKSDLMWLVYCYNCGDGNAVFYKALIPNSRSVLATLETHFGKGVHTIEDVMVCETGKNRLPDDFTREGEKWDVWAHERLWKHFTNASEMTAPPYYWGFSPSRNQLITPLYNEVGEEIGYQARLAPGSKPKCITTYYTGGNGKPLFYNGRLSRLVIVEDPLSAARLNLLGYSTMALLGTHMGDVATASLIRYLDTNGIPKMYVWLDGDAAGTEASRKVFVRLVSLRLSGKVVLRGSGSAEPKQIDNLGEEMKEWISRS